MTGPRLQAVTGTTDLYSGTGEVYRSRAYGRAWFTKFGWLPRGPESRLQPYLSLSSGYGSIVHLASLNSIPSRHLEAILALEALLGAPDRTYNLDLNLGLAFVL
jgi:hypothetical protein